jgi:hypothetical protein
MPEESQQQPPQEPPIVTKSRVASMLWAYRYKDLPKLDALFAEVLAGGVPRIAATMNVQFDLQNEMLNQLSPDADATLKSMMVGLAATDVNDEVYKWQQAAEGNPDSGG